MSYDQTLIDDKVQLAILYFKTKEYANALQIYNDVIKRLSSIPVPALKQIRRLRQLIEVPLLGPIIHPQLGSILDQRAATYEKLGSLDKALKDGERLVKLEPISCKGYLRKGKILLVLGKEIEAFKVFQQGVYIIEKVQKESGIEPPAKLFEALKTQYRDLNRHLKLKRKQSQSQTSQSSSSSQSSTTSATSSFGTGLQDKLNQMLPLKRNLQSNSNTKRFRPSIDPFDYLPRELIALIFTQLSTRTRLDCHTVSRKWYKALTNIPQLYVNFHCKYKVAFNEFKYGSLLLKRVVQNSYSRQIKSLKITETPTLIHLSKILDTLIGEPGFSIQSLDIFDRYLNLQLILSKFSKFGWRLNNFQNLHTLKLGINSSLRYEKFIFVLFKKLKHLRIVTYLPELSGASNDNLPLNDKQFIRYNNDSVDYVQPLESLILINHPKLVQEEIHIAASMNSYNPFPIFLTYEFPYLTELTMVSYDFYNQLPMFGEFLLKTTQLKRLTLENNCNFCMMDMLQLLKNYNPEFVLEKFGFRDKIMGSPMNLNEFSLADLRQLQSLSILDLTGSSLTSKGFKKLLKVCNKNGKLSKLYIGESSNLYFPVDMFIRNRQWLRLEDIMLIAPKLAELYLNGLELDNYTMKQFCVDLKKLKVPNQLQVLDLSFCNKINGMGILELFDLTNLQTAQKSEKLLQLNWLIIDGIEIKKETLTLLSKQGYVNSIKNNLASKKWKSFGETSWVL